MNLIKQIGSVLGTVLLLLILWGVARWLPSLKRVIPASGYDDMSQIDKDETTGVDGTVTLAHLRHGDVIAFRTDVEDDENIAFGYVAALPGETLRISDGTLAVNDKPFTDTDIPQNMGDVPALTIPRDHVYVLSERHQFDSTAYGPIPGRFLLGRVKE
ncbi:MAG: S26 family signal peptidase [Planctomycetota bacterium]|nr:S26 family signal peptidase [Planctomycetota bacterium]